jgi:hypothetical protein
MKKLRQVKVLLLVVIVGVAAFYVIKFIREHQVLSEIIERLSAESRVAEVLVSEVKTCSKTNKNLTTIKFLEYDTNSKPLEPKYFTFSENIIQFQSMVIRFDDFYIKKGDALRGKSAYIFMQAFALTDHGAEVFQINKMNEIPSGYKIKGINSSFEDKLWKRFWEYALDPQQAKRVGVKNAQIEAPGTKFIPGMLYTIKIEHDAGLRIDAEKISPILKGENIEF